MIHWQRKAEKDSRIEKDEKRKTLKYWIVVGTFVISVLSPLGWIVYTTAQTNKSVETISTSWIEMDKFRVETIRGTATQLQINEQLKNQLKELEKRADRQDAIHKLPPIGYDGRK